jgi:hypothetical protein
MGILKSTYISYKQENKKGVGLYHIKIRGVKSKRTPMIQVESNIQFLIEQCVDVMLHQMKDIGNGRQDVCLFLPDTWRTRM